MRRNFFQICSVAACLVTVGNAFAATEDLIVNNFDQAAEAAEWARWWGGAPQAYEFDSAVDAANSASSGSLRVTVNFDRAAYGGDNQFSSLKALPQTINAAEYTNLVFDLLWDPNSPKRPWGDFGRLEYGFRNQDWSQTYVGFLDVPATPGWIRVTAPINPTLPKLDTVNGIHFKMWSGASDWGQTGTAIFWVDNVKLVAITNGVQVPPPTLSITKPTQGLELIASHPSDPYQRQSIRSAQANMTWIDSFDPLDIAITVKKFPSPTYSGFHTHLFLVPPPALPFGPGDAYPDWNAAHVIFLQIANNANGTAYARFMYKTNQPSGNSMFWNSNPANGPVGTLAIIGSSSPLGTWRLRLLQEQQTTITITTPDGSSTNFAMPAESVEVFADHANGSPLYAWFGAQPNSAAGIGQSVVLGRIRVERDAVLVDDDFSTGLNSANWSVAAANPPGVVAVPAHAACWLSWTLPDLGFTLEGAAELPAAAWQTVGGTPIQVLERKRLLLLNNALLGGGNSGFFRLRKPATP